MASLRAFSPPEEGTPYMKGVGMLVVSLSAVISDFGLAQGVLGKTLLYLAVKVSFRVAIEKILKKKNFLQNRPGVKCYTR